MTSFEFKTMFIRQISKSDNLIFFVYHPVSNLQFIAINAYCVNDINSKVSIIFILGSCFHQQFIFLSQYFDKFITGFEHCTSVKLSIIW